MKLCLLCLCPRRLRERDRVQPATARRALCPSSPPKDGATPARTSATNCSWGTDERFGCRTLATCGNGEDQAVWVVTQASCPEPPPKCPDSAPASDAGKVECSDARLGLTCVYDEVAYTCTPCSGTLCFTKNYWSVQALSASCPSEMPNLGAGCGDDGLFCDYNVCANDEIPPDQWAFGIPDALQGRRVGLRRRKQGVPVKATHLVALAVPGGRLFGKRGRAERHDDDRCVAGRELSRRRVRSRRCKHVEGRHLDADRRRERRDARRRRDLGREPRRRRAGRRRTSRRRRALSDEMRVPRSVLHQPEVDVLRQVLLEDLRLLLPLRVP